MRRLTQEAVKLLFSLPEDPVSSGDDGDSSSSDEEPRLVLLDEHNDEDWAAPSTSKGRKRKSYNKQKPKKKQRASLENTEVIDEDEIQDGISNWDTTLPSTIQAMPKTWDPCYSAKNPTKASDAFSLYFDGDVLDLIVCETNRYAKQKARRDWRELDRCELEAFLGMLLLMSINPLHHFYLYWSSEFLPQLKYRV